MTVYSVSLPVRACVHVLVEAEDKDAARKIAE